MSMSIKRNANRILKLGILLILPPVFSLPITFAQNKQIRVSVGTVMETKGAPNILRNPREKLPEEHKLGRSKGFIYALYRGKYWESSEILVGSKIYYGDVLSSG